jgi:hypothetical protein
MAAKEVGAKVVTERGRFWVRHFRRWVQSGLPRAEYCRRHHLSFGTMSWWKTQLPRALWAPEPADAARSSVDAFIELPIGQGSEESYEITLRTGRSLRLGGRFDLVQVRQLVQMLEQAC